MSHLTYASWHSIVLIAPITVEFINITLQTHLEIFRRLHMAIIGTLASQRPNCHFILGRKSIKIVLIFM